MPYMHSKLVILGGRKHSNTEKTNKHRRRNMKRGSRGQAQRSSICNLSRCMCLSKNHCASNDIGFDLSCLENGKKSLSTVGLKSPLFG